MKIQTVLTIVFLIAYTLFMMTYGNYLSWQVGGTTAIFLWMLAGLIASFFVWAIWSLELRKQNNSAKQEENIEKKKRERIDSVLRDLSDEDLVRLKKRLVDGTIDDERLEEALMGGDSELVKR